ncbi:MAG: flippase-like domain-containing protein [Chloroflexi bacterium]|nr:flippase-like domain-containing protein [Chloroflexota bacterium]
MSKTQSDNENPLIAGLKRYRGSLPLGLRIVIAVGLMAFVVSLVWQDRHQFDDVDWTLIPLAWSLTLLSTGVKAFRWSLLVRQSHLDIPYRRLLGTYFVGAFFNTILPSSVGGDAVRAVDTANKTGRAVDSTSSVLIERGMGLLAIAMAGSICALVLEPDVVPLPFLLLVHAMTLAGISGIVVLRQGWFIQPINGVLRRFKLGKVADKVDQVQRTLSGHLGRPAVLGQMFVLSVLANALTMGATYLVLVAVTEPIKVAAFVPMIALATVAELIPISIASLGVKESAYVFFLGLADVGSAEAGVIAIIMRVLTWGHALVGGIVFMTRGSSKPTPTDTPVPS